jgi:hypothetical protein
MEMNKQQPCGVLLQGIVSREAVVVVTRRVCRLSLVCIHLVGRKEVGRDLGDHVDDLVLGLGGDRVGLLGGFGCFCAHVGTLGESAELVVNELVFFMNFGVQVCTYSFNDHAGDLVGVGVGGRPAVLEVTLALLGAGAVDTDGSAAVGNAPGELVI